MPITIPAHLIPPMKPRVHVEKVAQRMIDAAHRDADGSFVVNLPSDISAAEPVAAAIWGEIDSSLGAAGVVFSVTLFEDGGRTRRYVPAIRREG